MIAQRSVVFRVFMHGAWGVEVLLCRWRYSVFLVFERSHSYFVYIDFVHDISIYLSLLFSRKDIMLLYTCA